MYSLIPPNHLSKHDTPPRKGLKRRASSIIESLTTTFSHSGISSSSHSSSNLKIQTPIIITTPDLKVHTKIELNQFSTHTQKKLNHRHHKTKSSTRFRNHHPQQKQQNTLDSNPNTPSTSNSKSSLFQDFLNLNSHSKNQKDKPTNTLRKSQSKSYQNQSKHPYQSQSHSKQHQYHYSKSRFSNHNTMRSKGINISSLEEVMMNHFGSGDQKHTSNLSFYNHSMPNSKSGLSLNSNGHQKENQKSDQIVIDEVDDPVGLFSPTGRGPVKRSLSKLNHKSLGLKVKAQTPISTPFSVLSPDPVVESFNKTDQTSQQNETKSEEVEKTPNLTQSTGSHSISSFYSLDSSLNQSQIQAQPSTQSASQTQQRLQMTFQNSLVNFNSESQSVSPIERFSILKNPTQEEIGSVWSMVNTSNSLQSLSSRISVERNPPTPFTTTARAATGNNTQFNSLRKKLSQGFKDSLHKRFRKV